MKVSKNAYGNSNYRPINQQTSGLPPINQDNKKLFSKIIFIRFKQYLEAINNQKMK